MLFCKKKHGFYIIDDTISSLPLELKNIKDIEVIEKKAKKLLALIKKGIKLFPTQPNVLKIYNDLITSIKK